MRLIDADELKEVMTMKIEDESLGDDLISDVGFGVMIARSYLIRAKTVDPIKHGRWTEEHECSVCHNKAHSDIYNVRPEYDYDWEEELVPTGDVVYDEDFLETDWCPYCGARMNEEVSGCD